MVTHINQGRLTWEERVAVVPPEQLLTLGLYLGARSIRGFWT